MKKSYLLIGMLAFGCVTAFAQRNVGTVLDHSEKSQMSRLFMQGEAVNDTVNPSVLTGCDVGPYLATSANGGYVAGTNGYGDKEKAQGLLTASSGSIYSVLALFGGKSAAGSGNFQAKIYDFDATTGPGALRGTSSDVSFANIDTTGFTMFPFTTPIPYTNNFFASIVVDNISAAEIGLYHTEDFCGGGTAWELWSDDTWYAFNDANAWGLDYVLYVFAEVESTPVGDNEHLIERGSHKVFPNPAKNEAHLIYSLVNSASNVDIAVYSVNGQQVASYPQGSQTSGLHGIDLNVADLAAGTYFYTITSDGDATQGKFVVTE